MTPEELDTLLRSHTEREDSYLEGGSSYWSGDFPLAMVGGRSYPKLTNESLGPLGQLLVSVKKTARFDPTEVHVSDWVEILYQYSGESTVRLPAAVEHLNTGQVLLIDSGVPHGVDALGEDDILISVVMQRRYLDVNFFNRFSQTNIMSEFFVNAISGRQTHDQFIVFFSEHNRRVRMYFIELLCELEDPTINSPDVVSSLFTLIFIELINVERQQHTHDVSASGVDVIEVLHYLEDHYRDCTLKQVAEEFGLNPNYLTTLLKERTGHSFKELVTLQRLSTAAFMLKNTTGTVEDIASAMGYSNLSFFYRSFKRQFDMTPAAYRNNHS